MTRLASKGAAMLEDLQTGQCPELHVTRRL